MSVQLRHLQIEEGFNRLGEVVVPPNLIEFVIECMRKSCVPPRVALGMKGTRPQTPGWCRGMRAAFSAWAHVQCHDAWLKKERFSSFGGGRWNTSVGKHERMTHQIRIATIIRPAFCRCQSDLEGETTIPDLFLELR